jgi:hypothetical protein
MIAARLARDGLTRDPTDVRAVTGRILAGAPMVPRPGAPMRHSSAWFNNGRRWCRSSEFSAAGRDVSGADPLVLLMKRPRGGAVATRPIKEERRDRRGSFSLRLCALCGFFFLTATDYLTLRAISRSRLVFSPTVLPDVPHRSWTLRAITKAFRGGALRDLIDRPLTLVRFRKACRPAAPKKVWTTIPGRMRKREDP